MVAYREIAAQSAQDMFSMCKYLIVNLVFPTSVLSGNFFLIAPFPDHCIRYLFKGYTFHGHVFLM